MGKRFLSTAVDSDASLFWKMFYSLSFDLDENLGRESYFLLCGYVLEYDGDPHDEDGVMIPLEFVVEHI